MRTNHTHPITAILCTIAIIVFAMIAQGCTGMTVRGDYAKEMTAHANIARPVAEATTPPADEARKFVMHEGLWLNDIHEHSTLNLFAWLFDKNKPVLMWPRQYVDYTDLALRVRDCAKHADPQATTRPTSDAGCIVQAQWEAKAIVAAEQNRKGVK